MKKIWTLSTCKTCERILDELNLSDEFEIQDVKKQIIDAETLDKLKEKAGSYEALINKQSRKYKSLGLSQKAVSEQEYRELILTEYTLLRRPVILCDDQLFIGNSKTNVEAAKSFFN